MTNPEENLSGQPLRYYRGLSANALRAYHKKLQSLLIGFNNPQHQFEITPAGGIYYRFLPAWEKLKFWGNGRVSTTQEAQAAAEKVIALWNGRWVAAIKAKQLPEDFPAQVLPTYKELLSVQPLYINSNSKPASHYWTVSYQLLLQQYDPRDVAGKVPQVPWLNATLQLHISKGGMLLGLELNAPLVQKQATAEPFTLVAKASDSTLETEPLPDVVYRGVGDSGLITPHFLSMEGYLPATKVGA